MAATLTDVGQFWPLFELSLQTPRLELRPVRDVDLPQLIDAALAGIHDPGRMPFGVPWTDAEPTQLAQSFAAYHWRLRANVQPKRWGVSFTVLHDGVPVGIQEVHAREFSTRRTIESGSWLTASAQGRGLGTEMRAGLLLFAFDHLGAKWAESSAVEWNAASLAVSKRLGYVANGITRAEPRPGEPVDEHRVRLSVDDFVRPSWHVVVRCPEAVLAQLGARK
jgi:RimJ/RimL family protein N-acetyltransferase